MKTKVIIIAYVIACTNIFAMEEDVNVTLSKIIRGASSIEENIYDYFQHYQVERLSLKYKEIRNHITNTWCELPKEIKNCTNKNLPDSLSQQLNDLMVAMDTISNTTNPHEDDKLSLLQNLCFIASSFKAFKHNDE